MGRCGRRSNGGSALFALALVLASAGCSGTSDPQRGSAAGAAAQETPAQAADPTPEDPRVLGYPAGRLPAGVNHTSEHEEATSVDFEVPAGWFGEQSSPKGWVLLWGPRPDMSKASLWVDELDMDFEEAVAGFKRVKNLRVPRPVKMQIDGRQALLFAAEVTRGEHAILDEALGVGIDVVGWIDTRQVLVNLGDNAMIVRIELPEGERYLPQALEVLRSFRFSP